MPGRWYNTTIKPISTYLLTHVILLRFSSLRIYFHFHLISLSLSISVWLCHFAVGHVFGIFSMRSLFVRQLFWKLCSWFKSFFFLFIWLIIFFHSFSASHFFCALACVWWCQIDLIIFYTHLCLLVLVIHTNSYMLFGSFGFLLVFFYSFSLFLCVLVVLPTVFFHFFYSSYFSCAHACFILAGKRTKNFHKIEKNSEIEIILLNL